MRTKVTTLAMNLFEITQKKFPEIRFVNIQEHPEQVDRYWINVAGDMEEDREIQMDEFVATEAMKILVKHGYSFAVMLDNRLLEAVH